MAKARTLGAVAAAWHTLLDVALRTSVVYLALLVGLRLTGTRQLGQMSTFDLVLLLIIANAVQNAMVGPDTSLAGGLVAAGVLIGWHRVIDWWRLRSEEHTSELQSLRHLVCRLLLEKKNQRAQAAGGYRAGIARPHAVPLGAIRRRQAL